LSVASARHSAGERICLSNGADFRIEKIDDGNAGSPINACPLQLADSKRSSSRVGLKPVLVKPRNPFSIQRIAGHASILVSQRYAHPTRERLEDAFVRLERYTEVKEQQRKASEYS
jgi:hypothetical protein